MDSTHPDMPTLGHLRVWYSGSIIPALVDLPKALWATYARRSELRDLSGRISRCETCEHKEWCDRHAFCMKVLVEEGADAYWEYADYLDREGYPAIYRMAREYADREKRGRKRGDDR